MLTMFSPQHGTYSTARIGAGGGFGIVRTRVDWCEMSARPRAWPGIADSETYRETPRASTPTT